MRLLVPWPLFGRRIDVWRSSMQSFSFLYDIILQDRIKMIGKNIRQARFIRWRIYVFNKKKKSRNDGSSPSIAMDCLKIKFWNRVFIFFRIFLQQPRAISFFHASNDGMYIGLFDLKLAYNKSLKIDNERFLSTRRSRRVTVDLFVTIFRFEFDNPCRDTHWSSKRSFHVPCCARESWI